MTPATFTYLKLEEALVRIGDEELVSEMLHMLQQSIQQDWLKFEDFVATHRYSEAGKILHILKGTVPFFTAYETVEVMQRVEKLLKSNNIDLPETIFLSELRVHIVGFMSDLNAWVERN
jgi:HPt (histidine-containing phosphotransfer) domain-containing protein